MKNIIEIEFKFQVLDKKQIEAFLNNLKFISRKRIVDVYLDTTSGDLYKKGIFIRIRDNKTLDFKFNPEDLKNLEAISNHEHCDEHSVSLPLTNGSLKALNQNCNILGLSVIKTPNLEEFKNLNNFVESVLIDKVRGLKLKLITTGYNELYWRKHNFDLYRQGRYLLEEDR